MRRFLLAFAMMTASLTLHADDAQAAAYLATATAIHCDGTAFPGKKHYTITITYQNQPGMTTSQSLETDANGKVTYLWESVLTVASVKIRIENGAEYSKSVPNSGGVFAFGKIIGEYCPGDLPIDGNP
ncbi:MAG: hypothetical protein ABL977_08510 [Candidatus Eisenbacteria bacterium]